MKRVLIVICLVIFISLISGCSSQDKSASAPQKFLRSRISKQESKSESSQDLIEEGGFLESYDIPPWIKSKNDRYWYRKSVAANREAQRATGSMKDWRKKTAKRQRRIARD